MALQVSSLMPQSLGNVAYSPSSRFLVSSVGSKVNVMDSASLETLHVFSCVDKVEKCEISPDSGYILCALMSRGIVQCFSIADPAWRCRINESVAGIVSARWCPDSRHIAIESDFGIQLAIWSLSDNNCYVISSPKPNVGPSFSECGRFMAVAHRMECKDYIGIYATGPWSELTKFRCQTSDLSSVNWTPSGAYLIVVDSNLTYKLIVYSTSGEIVHEYEAYQNALGIRCMAQHKYPISIEYSPGDGGAGSALGSAGSEVLVPHPLLAVGSYDGNVRLLSTRTWAVAFVLPAAHTSEMTAIMHQGVVTTVEIVNAEESTDLFSFVTKSAVNSTRGTNKPFGAEEKYGNAYVTKSLKSLPRVAVDPHSKSGPQIGVNWLGWSGDGQLLAVRAENFPRCLWIWNAIDGQLNSLLVQMSAITCARWRPHQVERPNLKPMLAFCTGVSRVYFWTPMGTSWVDIPANSEGLSDSMASARPDVDKSIGAITGVDDSRMLVTSLKWSPDGRKLLLVGKGAYCTCDISSDEALFESSAAT